MCALSVTASENSRCALSQSASAPAPLPISFCGREASRNICQKLIHSAPRSVPQEGEKTRTAAREAGSLSRQSVLASTRKTAPITKSAKNTIT